MEAAAAFLSVRPRSVTETRRRLLHNGYPAPLVDEVVTKLIEMEYLDDAAFAAGRIAVLQQLLLRPFLYATDYGRAHWEERARTNLHVELEMNGRDTPSRAR